MPWTFHDFLNERGQNVIRLWLDGLPLKARGKIDSVLRNLRVSDQLKPPFIKKIKTHSGVFEIVVNSFNVQYRPLGGHGPQQGQFTLVLGAIEQNKRIQPPSAFATAEGRIESVIAGTSRVCDHEYENKALDSTP